MILPTFKSKWIKPQPGDCIPPEMVKYFYFYLYIYPPDSQESDGGAVRRVSHYPDLLPEMPRYCCPLVI